MIAIIELGMGLFVVYGVGVLLSSFIRVNQELEEWEE